MTPPLAVIRDLFSEAAFPENALPMQTYMRNIAPFLGIKAPARKAIEEEIFLQYKPLSYERLESLLRLLWAQPEREFHYLAMDWLWHRRKDFQPETIGLLEEMLTTQSWWDTVDFLSSKCLGYWVEKFPEKGRVVIQSYIQSPNLWLVRSAMLHQLTYKKKTDTQMLADCLEPHLLAKAFFLRKAIGWALRQYGRTNPVWVIDFVESHPQLSNLSRREALKHL